ncbi:MAG: ethanolamine utilization protein EutN [Phycisphaera sp.]|nr:ethanolamine utilization protein EutN [Phycisphaera sp.]
MFIATVKGHVVATCKDPTVNGYRLLVVEPMKVDYDEKGGGTFGPTGRAIVAMDTIGAAEGQLVLIVQGSSARMASGMNKVPVDAVVIGLVDSATVMGKKLF